MYFDLAGKQLCFPPAKSINGRKENTGHNLYFSSEILTIITQYCKTSLIASFVTVIFKMISRFNSYNKVLLIDHHFSPSKMTIRNKKKMGALNKENCEEHPRSNLAQNSSAPRSQQNYITQVSEEIEGRVTKKLSKGFSRTENRNLGALARLDDFLMNPLLPGHSGTTPEPTRNALKKAGERMKTNPRMILILKRVTSTAR